MCTWGDAMSAELHPPAGTLTDYAAGALDEVGTERIREHLAECSHCTRIVLDLSGAAERDDPTLIAAWREQADRRERLGHRSDRRWLRSGTRTRALRAVAASLLLALVFAGGVMVGGRWPGGGAVLDQPQVGPPELELLPLGSLRSGSRIPTLRLPGRVPWFSLTLILLNDPDPTTSSTTSSLELAIEDAGGHELWTGEGRPDADRSHLTVAVPGDFLPAGEIRVVVRSRDRGPEGTQAAGSRILGVYPFRLERAREERP